MTIPDTEIKGLEIGDVIYECEMFHNVEARVTSKPVLSGTLDGRNQWKWEAENTQNGEKISYLLTEGLPHYGPRLYRSPQYCRTVNGEMAFPLYGEKDQRP